ncbi:MAG: hypothetical protein ACE5E4_07030 [Candidatus Binatia bacterium]
MASIVTTSLSIALLGFLTAQPRPAAADPYQIDASWVESGAQIRPEVDFVFRRIDYVPGRGTVMLADSLVLRVQRNRPYVILGWPRHRQGAESGAEAVAALGEDGLVFAGYQRSAVPGAYLRLRSRGRWTSLPLPWLAERRGADQRRWAFGALATGPGGRLYAWLTNGPEVWRKGEGLRPRSSLAELREPTCPLFVLEGESWRQLPPPIDQRPYRVAAMCSLGTGRLWLAATSYEVGSSGIESSRGFLAAYDGQDWRRYAPPQPFEQSSRSWQASLLACARDGSVWMSAVANRFSDDGRLLGASLDESGEALLGFAEGRWSITPPLPARVFLPERPPSRQRVKLSALAADDVGRPWVAYASEGLTTERLFRLEGGSWRGFDAPPVPATSRYTIKGMAFDEEGRGWAVAEGRGEGPFYRGILLTLDGERWTHRNWTWSRWQQRGFGLFGP